MPEIPRARRTSGPMSHSPSSVTFFFASEGMGGPSWDALAMNLRFSVPAESSFLAELAIAKGALRVRFEGRCEDVISWAARSRALAKGQTTPNRCRSNLLKFSE